MNDKTCSGFEWMDSPRRLQLFMHLLSSLNIKHMKPEKLACEHNLLDSMLCLCFTHKITFTTSDCPKQYHYIFILTVVLVMM